MLTESVIVALAGGLLGLLIAFWFIDAMLASIPEELPYWLHVDIDPIVLAYAVAVSVATGLIFGLMPAVRASRTDLQQTLKDGGRGTSGGGGNRLRGALVSGQVALSLVLLVSASLMMRSFLAVGSADSGFDPAPLLTARTYMAGDRYAGVDARADFLASGVDRLQGLPGVVAAAATSAIPTDDGGSKMPVVAEGQPRAAGDELIGSVIASTPGLFDALGTPLRAGRTFTARETADSASMVVIVNRELAAQLWPGAEPIGRRIRLPLVDSVAWLTVVGVAPDIVYDEFGESTAASRRQVHLPYGRMPRRYMGLVVRSQGAAGVPAAGLREAMRAIDPALPTFDVRTMDEVRRSTTWNYALYGRIFSVFSAIALLLAAIGIYGVVAYAVSQRTHEIGVRMALGADSRGVQRLIVMQGARMVAAGLAIGLVAAIAAGRAVSGLLYAVPPTDPLSFVLVPLVLAAVALLACWVPARRATRVSPVTALRAG
jgi:putative ABC transport system permease protein